MYNFGDCRVRFFNIQEGGRFPPGSCFDRPRIAEKVGEPVEPSTRPHCGAQTPHPQNHARRVPQPCSHGNGRAAGVSITPGLAPSTRPEMQNTTTLTVAVFCINDFDKLSDKSYARFFVIGK